MLTMVALARLRPARSRAATAIALSPAFGSGTATGLAKAGGGGRLRARGSRPGLAQPLSVRPSKQALIGHRPLCKLCLKF